METDGMARNADSSTRQRLLDAAGRLFARKGLRAATVREICDNARANVAAVNYHFGSKNRLYRAVLDDLFDHAMGRHPIAAARDDDRPAAERLHAFVHGFLLQLLAPDRPAWHHRLLAREMLEPSDEGYEVVARHVERARALLGDIITDVIGPADGELVERCRASIAGQCLHYHQQRLSARIMPHFPTGPDAIAAVARHITDFSMAGLQAVRERLRRERQP
jgi:AcrR family transcriptional regulator